MLAFVFSVGQVQEQVLKEAGGLDRRKGPSGKYLTRLEIRRFRFLDDLVQFYIRPPCHEVVAVPGEPVDAFDVRGRHRGGMFLERTKCKQTTAVRFSATDRLTPGYFNPNGGTAMGCIGEQLILYSVYSGTYVL